MAFHKFKGWEHGPADATHFSVQGVVTPWLKVGKANAHPSEGVYFAFCWPHGNWKWVRYEEYGEEHLMDAIVKQPAVVPLGIEVINGVEINWKEAPEGTTHAVIVHGVFIGWRKCTPEGVCWLGDNGWVNGGAVPHIWLDINKHCIFEHPNIRGNKPQAPKQEAPKPAPKKQVGWW